MKHFKTIALVAIVALSVGALSSCDLFDLVFGSETTMELANRTGRPLMKIRWNGFDLGTDNAVWSNLDMMNVKGIQPGQNCTCDVGGGSDYIRFSFADEAAIMDYRSSNMVNIEDGDNFFFELNSSNWVMN